MSWVNQLNERINGALGTGKGYKEQQQAKEFVNKGPQQQVAPPPPKKTKAPPPKTQNSMSPPSKPRTAIQRMDDARAAEIAVERAKTSAAQPSPASVVTQVEPEPAPPPLTIKKPEGPTIYDIARQRTAQQSSSSLQGQQDAMKRRFAAMGGINSGAALKANQLAAEESQRQLSDANQAITAQETADLTSREQDLANKQFARDERLGSQAFASRERAAGQQFSLGERLSQQEFTRKMAQLDRSFQAKQKGLDRALSSKQWNAQFQQALEQFEYDKYVNGENLRMAQAAQNDKGLLDMIGL